MSKPSSNPLISSLHTSMPTMQTAQTSNQNPNIMALQNQSSSSQSSLASATLDAQKKARLAGPSSKKVKFTKAEDAKLAMLVSEYSDNDWKTIAEHMAPRTARQCRERWTNYVNPSLSKDPWTPEEDLLLIEKHKEFGNHWKIIERYFTNRSKNNIKHRWASMKESYPNSSSISTPPPSTIQNTESPSTAPINSVQTTTAFHVSDIQPSINSPSPELSQASINHSNASIGRRSNRKKSSNGNSLHPSSNITVSLATTNSNAPQTVALPQINKIPQPVVNVSLQNQTQMHSNPMNLAPEQRQAAFTAHNQPNPMSFPLHVPFLDSGAGGVGRNGGYGMSTGIRAVSDFIGDVDVDTIREGDVSSYATLDPFQFFDRILDQHEVYVQSMDKTDFWSIPEENYF